MNTLTTNFEGNSTSVLQNNNDILHNLCEINKDKLTTISGLPFYSGGEFKLPETMNKATNMIENISTHINSITQSTTFVGARNEKNKLEKEDSDDSKTYKKLLIRAMIIIHWQFNYLNNNNSIKPTRVDFILKILSKLHKCSKNYWGLDSEYTSTSITDVMVSLTNGNELDIVMMNFPTKALHIYGW